MTGRIPGWTAVASALILAGLACSDGMPAERAEAPPVEARATELPYPLDLTEEQRTGRLVFETLCWTCHGEAGRGNGPAVAAGSVPAPPDFHDEPIRSLTREELARRFRRAMEGDDPSHPHMRSVVSLVKPERFSAALAYVPVLVWPSEIPGSAMAGRARYERLCMGCHGEDGRGHGSAAEVLLVPPASFPDDSLVAARDWDAVFGRIKEGGRVHGSSMPPWGVMLSEPEIWDLVAYVASFQPETLSESPLPARGP